MFVSRLEKRLKDKDMGIELTSAAKVLLATRGDDAKFTFAGNAKPRIPDALPAAG